MSELQQLEFNKFIIMKFLAIIFFPILVFSQGTFFIESGITISSSGDPIINLYNTNLQNNTGNNNLGSGTIWGFSGNIPQTIYGTYISNFYGLRLNNTNGFTIQSNTIVSNRLDMISGDISLSGYTFDLGTSISNTGELNWSGGTIIGPLKRWFGTSANSSQSSGIFPIGNSSTNRNIIINYTEAPTDGGYIIAEYKSGLPSMTDVYNGLPIYASDNQLIQNYENQGYFEITPFDYNSSLNSKKYTLTMRGNGLTTVNDRTTTRLIKSPGPSHSTWVNCGEHSLVNGTMDNDFSVTSINVTGFSWFNFGSDNGSPLPVELLYFDGTPYPAFNKLFWSTASEHNSDYFQIEESLDGEKWNKTIKKKAAGNSNSPLNYSVLVPIKEFGPHYYKLNQVDINGASKIYGPIVLANPKIQKEIMGYYNLLGQEIILDGFKGIYIVLYVDGTSEKGIR
jgi:hypothetical protein